MAVQTWAAATYGKDRSGHVEQDTETPRVNFSRSL